VLVGKWHLLHVTYTHRLKSRNKEDGRAEQVDKLKLPSYGDEKLNDGKAL
jgi:hypothetical protein